MVTGAETAVGRSAVRLLASSGGEVRVFVQSEDGAEGPVAAAEGFRAAGCKVALGDLDDEAHVETALEQVHTVLHLLGRPTDDPDDYLDRTATVIGAAIGAGCRRLVLLSDLAAADPGGNAWLDALAEAEEMALDAPLESVVLRSAVIHGPDDLLTRAVAAGALGPAPAGAHWPVAAVDVAATAVLADAERDLDAALHVVVPVAGPARMTTEAYATALGRLLPDEAPRQIPDAARELMTRVVERPAEAIGSRGRALESGL